MSTAQTDRDGIEARLALAQACCGQRGARLTPLRLAVLRLLLLREGRFTTAYELLARVRETHGSVQAMTIYRVLDFLIDQGLVHRLDTVNGYVACEHAVQSGHRVFAICMHCARVSEIQAEAVHDMLKEQMARAGFTMEEDRTEITAVCCSHCLPQHRTSGSAGEGHWR